MRTIRALCVALLAGSLLVGCGGGSDSASPGNRGGGGVALLAGAPGDRALAALPPVAPVRAAPGDIDARGLLLTRLSVVLKLDATVGDVNAAAQAVGATSIAFARPHSPFITLAVERQNDGAALDRLASQLNGRPGILVAVAARELRPHELPPAPADVSEADHLLATRFPAAWNLRRRVESDCATRKVTLIVPDLYFGTPANFPEQMQGAVEFDPVPLEPLAGQTANSHGYDVIGTLAAKFDGTLSHGAMPAPQCLRIHAVDVSGVDAGGLIDRLTAAIEAESGPVIVSSSVGYRINEPFCPAGCVELPANFALDARRAIFVNFLFGIRWAEFAMRSDVLDRVLLVQSAGNDAAAAPAVSYPGLRDARLNSPIAIATVLGELDTIASDAALWAPAGLPSLLFDPGDLALLKGLRDALLPGAPSARNLTIVGSTTNRELLADLTPSDFSNPGADLYAVGEGVATIEQLVKNGTSFAAPQVAALASMLWLFDDGLQAQPVEQTLALIRAASHSNGRAGAIIDCYDTLLTVDARRQRLSLRKSLLDVSNDGVFDHLDVLQFLQAYANDPATRDYSRFDLNGDGATGGIGTQRFDLDAGAPAINGAAQINSTRLPIEGYDVQMNEPALSDLQILCYYAYVADANGVPLLYDSRPDAITERTRLLGPDRCVGARLDVQLPARITASAALAATVTVPTGNGQFGPGANLLVQLAATCATVSPSQATTAADGSVTASVTPAAGCTSISIDLTVRASTGANALVRKTVSASAGDNGVYLNLGTADFLFGSPGVHVMAPLRRAETLVNLRRADGTLSGCGITNQPCLAHWDASGGTMIDGRPDGSLVGRVGTYTAGAAFGRFDITATSTTAEFPTTTDVMIIGPVGSFALHACTFFADESAASCVDSSSAQAAFVGAFDSSGAERYQLADVSRLTHLPEGLVFDVVDGRLTNFKSFNVRDGLVDPAVRGFALSDASADTEHLRFLVTVNGNEHTRVTLTRVAPPLP